METGKRERFVTLGPISASPGSRAFLAYENGPEGPLWPVVVVWVPEDVQKDPDRLAALQLDTDRAVLLDHPNVNRVVGCEKLAEGWARVVELGDGETVRRVLQASVAAGRTGLEPKLAARILADTAAGTHYVHEKGRTEGSVRWRLHGSIRPETVIVGFNGVSKITGYGANEVAPRDSFGPQATPRSQYLSPEEIERGTEATDRRSDVYALGLVFYEALAGRPPWTILDAGFEYKVLSDPLPLEPLAATPPALREVVVKALSRAPADRYQTAGAMAEAIEAAGPAAAADVAAELARLFPPEGEDRATRAKLLASAGFSGELPRPKPERRRRSSPAIGAAGRSKTGRWFAGEADAALSPRSGVPLVVVALASTAAAAVAGLVVYLATSGPRDSAAAARQPVAEAVAKPAPMPPLHEPPSPLTAVPLQPPPEGSTGAPVPAPSPGAVPTPPPLETATLALASEPSLAVTVDGEAKGSTPETIELPPGQHTIHFRDRAQGIDQVRNVQLAPGGHASVSVKPARAGMEVTAPAGSHVFLDGRAVGTAPVGTLHFYAGHHVIKVKMDKQQAVFERPFDADPDETLTLDVRPEKEGEQGPPPDTRGVDGNVGDFGGTESK